MKPNRQEKYDVLQDVARQLEHNITPFHTTKEREQIERKIEVLLEVAKEYKAEVVNQTSIFYPRLYFSQTD